MSIVLFPGGPLTGAFVPSAPFVMAADRVTIDFTIVVTTPGLIAWFIEFTDEDPTTTVEWFREVAEEDQGGGVTEMPVVIRYLRDNSPAFPTFVNLPAGTHRLSAQFVRHHKIARIQARITGGGAAATMRAVSQFGTPAIAP